MYYGPTRPHPQDSGLLAYCGANVLRPHKAAFPRLGALSVVRGECLGGSVRAVEEVEERKERSALTIKKQNLTQGVRKKQACEICSLVS